jgi:hypothetical protein
VTSRLQQVPIGGFGGPGGDGDDPLIHRFKLGFEPFDGVAMRRPILNAAPFRC